MAAAGVNSLMFLGMRHRNHIDSFVVSLLPVSPHGPAAHGPVRGLEFRDGKTAHDLVRMDASDDRHGTIVRKTPGQVKLNVSVPADRACRMGDRAVILSMTCLAPPSDCHPISQVQ
jgi:hypothetical protein